MISFSIGIWTRELWLAVQKCTIAKTHEVCFRPSSLSGSWNSLGSVSSIPVWSSDGYIQMASLDLIPDRPDVFKNWKLVVRKKSLLVFSHRAHCMLSVRSYMPISFDAPVFIFLFFNIGGSVLTPALVSFRKIWELLRIAYIFTCKHFFLVFSTAESHPAASCQGRIGGVENSREGERCRGSNSEVRLVTAAFHFAVDDC